MCTACSCSTTETSTSAAESETSATNAGATGNTSGHSNEFTVTGMTCDHCVSSVTEELQEIGGVRDVTVDLDSGAVTVTSAEPISTDTVTAAVREAGYQIA